MVVLLPDRELSIRSANPHPWVRDDHGTPVAPDITDSVLRGPYPGHARPSEYRGTWHLRCDVALLPIDAGDEISDGTLVWIVESSSTTQVPGVPDVDYVAVVANLRTPEES